MDLTELPITYRDGATSIFGVFPAETDTDRTYLVLPALGVRASFYKHLGAAIAGEGYNALTLDWRGHGQSSIRPGRGLDYGYSDYIQDLRESVLLAAETFPGSRLVLLGHSLGGQLGCLLISRYPELVRDIILVASCSVYYRGWDGWQALRVRMVGGGFHQLARLLGHFPGDKIGFGGREFPRLMRDWGFNARTGGYHPQGDDFDYETALGKVQARVKGISIENDDMAPERAVINLLNKFGEEAEVEHMHLTRNQTNREIDHFSWARQPEVILPHLL
jgi:predicted alpha/beta hydrolase